MKPNDEPPTLEQQIADAAKGAVGEAVRSSLTGYSSPLQKMVNDVVAERAGTIKDLLRGGLDSALDSTAFKKEIRDAFNHKLARTLMSKYEGEIEKQANVLRQQPEFRARVVLAIEAIVKEFSEVKP
jgi:hypothetical protein